MINEQVDPKDLPDVIGKEAAEKLLSSTPREYVTGRGKGSYHVLEGLDLKVGGEGMKGYYDKIVPETL